MSEKRTNSWFRTTLGELGRFNTSSVDKLVQPYEKPAFLVNYMDIYRHQRIGSNLKLQNVTATPDEHARFQVQKGDMLFTPSSETPDDIGRSAVVVEDLTNTLHSYHTVRLRPDGKFPLDIGFSAYFANAESVRRYFSLRAAGSTRYTLSLDSFQHAKVDLPPFNQQQRIAEILTTLDYGIEQTKALISKTQQIKSGLMHDLFTRGVTPDGQLRPPREQAPQLYKESSLGWIPREWEVERLDRVSSVSRGKFTIRPRNDPRYYSGTYPFIQTGDVASAAGRVTENFTQTLNARGLTVSRLFPAGTVMVTIAANIADTCILGIPMCAPDSLVGAVPNRIEDGPFVELSIRRRKRFLESRAPQTAQKNINLEDLRPLLIAWPDFEERLQIAQRLAKVETVLMGAEAELHKLSNTRVGLMHDLLAGRVTVPTPEAVST